eukprot:1551223-Prymnesium_polylepis.2
MQEPPQQLHGIDRLYRIRILPAVTPRHRADQRRGLAVAAGVEGERRVVHPRGRRNESAVPTARDACQRAHHLLLRIDQRERDPLVRRDMLRVAHQDVAPTATIGADVRHDDSRVGLQLCQVRQEASAGQGRRHNNYVTSSPRFQSANEQAQSGVQAHASGACVL